MTNGTIERKKFLFVSWESLSGDLAWQVKREGHAVKVYIKREGDKDVYEGMLDRVEEWEKSVDWADVVVFDDTGFGEHADRLRKAGKLVVGGSAYTDRLEEDREFGQAEMKGVGMVTLPAENFTSFDEAIKFVKENPGRYVLKPSGQISSEAKGLLFIGEDEDGKDLLEVMMHNKRVWSKKIARFTLQKYAAGVEVACGAFFNGKEFVQPINMNFEHKRLFPGELGPFTGEMGTACYWSDPNNMFNATLGKMKESLAQSGYVGYVDVNCIATSKAIYPLEFTCRFGYPTISLQMEGIQTPMGELLYRMAKGESFQFKTKRGFQVCVVIAVPPFPYDDKATYAVYKDSSIIFKRREGDGIPEGVHLGDVKMEENDLHLAGDSGYALVITGAGTTMDEARRQAYARIRNILLQNMYYRTDIGERWSQDGDRLHTWGYIH
jgi:phosphoribosylamine--glycine ligase